MVAWRRAKRSSKSSWQAILLRIYSRRFVGALDAKNASTKRVCTPRRESRSRRRTLSSSTTKTFYTLLLTVINLNKTLLSIPQLFVINRGLLLNLPHTLFWTLFFCVIDKGENFNNCAILDDFVMGEILGTGGFGKVLLATDKLKKRKVAVKFIDVSEQRK